MGTERQVMQDYLDALIKRADYPALFTDDVVVTFEGTDQRAEGREAAVPDGEDVSEIVRVEAQVGQHVQRTGPDDGGQDDHHPAAGPQRRDRQVDPPRPAPVPGRQPAVGKQHDGGTEEDERQGPAHVQQDRDPAQRQQRPIHR